MATAPTPAAAPAKKKYLVNWQLTVGDTNHEAGATIMLTDAEHKALGLGDSKVLTRVLTDAERKARDDADAKAAAEAAAAAGGQK